VTDTPDNQGVDWEVQPDRVRIWEDEFHALHISVDDEEFADVRPKRAFPLSGKSDYVSFLAEKDKEVALLAHPHKLDKQSRKVLNRALRRMYYVPKILKVDEITETMGVGHWHVQTDRGYASFEVLDRNSHIRTLPGGRYLIVDVDGNRFEIENVNELDERSQTMIAHET